MFSFSTPAPSLPLHWGWRAALAGLATAGLWLGTSINSLAQPTITAVNPARNAESIHSTTFTATFSTPMDFNTSAAAFRVFGAQAGGNRTGFGVGNLNNNKLTIGLTSGFLPGEQVQASILTAATSSTGQPLAQGQVVQYRAAAGVGPGKLVPFPYYDAPTAPSPAVIASADVDGDNDLDLLIGNSATSTISISLNDGTGNFTAGTTIMLSDFAADLAVGDVDNDGDMDVVAAAAGLTVCRNNGLGAFTTNVYAAAAGTSSVTLGDLDADGDLDLALTNKPGKTVAMYRNNGAGGFGLGTTISLGPAPSIAPMDVALGDLDNDGDLDLAVAAGLASLQIITNDGNMGVVSRQSVYPFFLNAGEFNAVALGDMDGDGVLEIVGNGLYKGYNVMKRTANGWDYLSYSSSTYSVSIALADVDGDGDLDMVNGNTGGALIYSNDGTRLSQYATFVVGRGSGKGYLQLTTGDWDADGDLDVAAITSEQVNGAPNAGVSVLFNSNPLEISSTSPVAGQRNAPRNASLTATFNKAVMPSLAGIALRVFGSQADGKKSGSGTGTGQTLTFNPTLDFKPGERVLATITPEAVAMTGESLGSYARTIQFTAAAGVGPGVFATGTNRPGESLDAMAMGDVDGDGHLDLVQAAANGTLAISRNNGSGQFTAFGTVSSAGERAVEIKLADLENDGDLDMICANESYYVSVRLNNGAGVFGPAVNTYDQTEQRQPRNLTITDYDADGDLDCVVTFNDGGQHWIQTLFNDGSGTLSDYFALTVTGTPVAMRLGDLNGDGVDEAIIVSNSVAGSQVQLVPLTGSWFLFDPPITIASSTAAASDMDMADLDGDGDLDIAVTLAGTNTVEIHLNDGTGHIGSTTQRTVGANPQHLQLADINGDGHLDLLTSNATAGSVSVSRNNGNGTFGTPTDWLTAANSGHLETGDLDGDGDLDFVTANGGSSTLSIRFNAGDPDLIVDHVQSIPAGNYRNVTVTATGDGSLAGDIRISGTLLVQDGGRLADDCHRITGPGAFTLEAGAGLQICDANGISATGATGCVQVTGRRTFSNDAGYFYYGAQAQITGTGLPAKVRFLSTNKVTPLTLTNPVGIRRGVTLRDGNIVSNGKLTLLSDAAYTALVGNFTTGVITGEAIAQRYLDPSANPGLGFRHFSSPTTNSSISDLSASGFTALVNPLYNTNPTAVPANEFPNVFGFDESRLPASMTFTDGYFSPAALTDALVPGRGYTAYMRGTVKPDFRGTFNNGPVPVTLTKTGFGTVGTKPGWNFLGNPYPSPLNWDAIPANAFPVNMSHAVSVYKSTGAGQSGMYLSRINGIGSLPDGQIAMAQGFFVELTGGTSASFSFENAYREMSVVNPSHFRTAAPETRPIIGLTLQSTTAGALADEALVYFQNGATAAVDAAFDAARPAHNTGAAPTLASLTATGDELAINGLPETALATGQRIAIRLDVPTAGTYTLNLSRFENLAGADLSLYDALTNTTMPLTAGTNYQFTATTAGLIDGRFWLNVNTQRVTGTSDLSPLTSDLLTLFPNPAHGQVQLVAPGATTATLLDGLGRAVRTVRLEAGAATLDLTDLVPGVYVVRAGTRTQRLVVE